MSAAADIALHISVGSGHSETRRFDVSELPVSLGRSSANTVKLPFQGVSRRHCTIEHDGSGGSLRVRDDGSSTGTLRNGEPVHPTAPLAHGDVLRIGVAVVRVEVRAGRAPERDDDETRTTDRLPRAAAAIDCELCGGPIAARALREGGSAVPLADGRGLCAACAAQLDRLPRVGAFRVLRPLGQGASGRVEKVLQESTRRIFALKTIELSGTPGDGALRRALREIRLGKKLAHPAIVALHEAITDGTGFRLVLDFVDGDTLDALVRRGGPLPLDRAVRLARELAAALDHAHRLGVIHRDVKPSNVLVARDGAARLTDFGLARSITRSGLDALTRTGQGMGTPHYMAPEQYDQAKRAHRAADVYGLGATLYFAVTGRAPMHELRRLRDVYTASLAGRVEPPTSARPDLPVDASRVLLAAMAPDPTQRPRCAADVAAAFARAIGIEARA